MRAPESLLHRAAVAAGSGETSPPTSPEQQTAPEGMAVNSNMAVILASLLCALVCLLGLALASRCTCRRHRTSSPPPKGLKKKAIDALPTISYAASPESSPTAAVAAQSSSSECAICLVEFAEGEGLRVLPRCGHGFHVACVDAWLRTHATCPSCRAAIVAVEPPPVGPTVVVVVASEGRRCGRCGQVAAPGGCGDATPTFLP
ncbi:probable E3 ubiquitin-protein ligase ATL44 [Lolium perenne]|uniref:probable E3 ubiquitin-protein ligase ATL44 n=1 Tax=Lolium perenne TaxID=4522 RepID=UPI0021F5D264|nr:probable E3 ubiquitin-protein ligase ATL44 [Lolium perenne]